MMLNNEYRILSLKWKLILFAIVVLSLNFLSNGCHDSTHDIDEKVDLVISWVTIVITGFFVVVAIFISRYILVSQKDIFENEEIGFEDQVLLGKASYISDERQFRRQALWLINMRWIAIIISSLMIFLSYHVLSLLPEEVGVKLYALEAALVALNIWYKYLLPSSKDPKRSIQIQIILDLIILTGLLHFSGGIENTFFVIYIFHVILAGILLHRRDCFLIATVASALYIGMALAEMLDIIEHYTIEVFPHEVEGKHASHEPVYVIGQILPFTTVLYLTAYFTTVIMGHLRKSQHQVRQAAESAILEYQRLDNVLDATGAGLLLLSTDRIVLWSNRKVWELLNIQRDSNVKESPYQILKDTLGIDDADVMEAIQGKKVLRREHSIVGKGGNKRYFMVTVSPILIDGKVDQIVELIQDITDRKLVEAELLHSGKMAALGQLSAGIAHEIGNPLSSITTRLQLMQKKAENDFQYVSAKLLLEQVARISRIVHNVSQFTRPAHKEWMACDISELLTEVANMLRLDRRAKDVDIQLSVSEPNLIVNGVKDQLFQIFLNIGINALEAMADGGRLEIDCSHHDSQIRISFKDTGSGIPEEIKHKLFDPFFSTKAEGSGLGLSISDQIIQAHSGTIRVDSQQDDGTEFIVLLPKAPDEEAYIS